MVEWKFKYTQRDSGTMNVIFSNRLQKRSVIIKKVEKSNILGL